MVSYLSYFLFTCIVVDDAKSVKKLKKKLHSVLNQALKIRLFDRAILVWLGSLTVTCRICNPEVIQRRRFDSAPKNTAG